MDLLSKYDSIIEEFINDPNYVILDNGKILTFIQVNGKKGKILRECGSLDPYGYIRIKYKGKRFMAHRAVYRKFKGHLQEHLIVDREDKNRSNNHPDNLILTTVSGNNYQRWARR